MDKGLETLHTEYLDPSEYPYRIQEKDGWYRIQMKCTVLLGFTSWNTLTLRDFDCATISIMDTPALFSSKNKAIGQLLIHIEQREKPKKPSTQWTTSVFVKNKSCFTDLKEEEDISL